MNKDNLVRYQKNGLELIIDESTGETFASISGYARMSGKDKSTISRRFQTVAETEAKTAELPTATGFKTVALINEDLMHEWLIKDNPKLLLQCTKAGLRVYLYGLAGYEVKPSKPKTALELAKEQVKLLEQLELQEKVIKGLEKDNERQAEVIDELFDYSSIIRIAKYNNCSEKAFSWRKLKAASEAMNLEIKKVPCPRFVSKNLYSHDVWRFVYPEYKLPETTTLIINRKEQ